MASMKEQHRIFSNHRRKKERESQAPNEIAPLHFFISEPFFPFLTTISILTLSGEFFMPIKKFA